MLGTDTKKGELTAVFWHEDTAGEFEVFDDANVGFTTRRQLSENRRAIPVLNQIHADLFTQPRIMIDGVDVHVKLTHSPSTFCLMRANAQINEQPPPDFKIKIDSISLFVRKITSSDTC